LDVDWGPMNRAALSASAIPMSVFFVLGLPACNKSESATPAAAAPASPTPPPTPPPAAKPAEPPAAAPAPPPAEPEPVAKTSGAGTAALPAPAKLTEKAPAVFQAKFTTSKGDFVIEVHRDWAPNGADRFYNLVKNGYFDQTRFFRAIRGFMV